MTKPLTHEERSRIMMDTRRNCQKLADEALYMAFPGEGLVPDDDALRRLQRGVARLLADMQQRRSGAETTKGTG